MSSPNRARKRTRREFLRDAIGFGIGGAAMVALGPTVALPAFAQGRPPDRVEVMLADLVESTASHFARGQTRGVEIAANAAGATLRGSRGGEFVSGALSLPFPATHLGLHWVLRDTSTVALAVEVRTGHDGRNWSDWRPLAVEALADLPSGREVFAALAQGGRARFVQYRVRFQSDQITTLERMTVTALNSVDGPRQPAPSGASTTASFTAADGSTISVITREGWGCDESLRFRGKREIWPRAFVPAKLVILHHTATPNDYVDGAAEVRAIYTYHARTQGWGDIGYNSLVDRDGRIYEGRHGRGDGSSREVLSADVVAGHVLAHNYGSTGVAAIGDFGVAAPTDAMIRSIDDVATFECGRHFVDPTGFSDFLRSDDAWHAGLAHCSGHHESYPTECPGAQLIGYLPTLRDRIASRLGPSAVPTLSSTAPRELTEPAELAFSWSAPAGGPYRYSLEGWYKAPDQDDITYLSGYDSNKSLQWTPTSGTSASYQNLAVGHYTMHVRTDSGRYEANLTYLVKKAASTKPGRPPRK